MLIWTLVKKELRLLLRDRRAAFLLLVMPVLFIFILGLLLGEGFGQKPDDHSRIMIVDLDRGKGQVRGQSWAEVVREDLRVTGNLRIEKLETREEAEQLIRDHRRAAVLIFDPKFSDRINRCSFLADGINPFYGDGVNLEEIDAVLLKDETQHPGQAAILESVSQKSLVQVILPFMISRAFSKLSEREFIDQLGENVRLPVPETVTIPEQRRILFRLAGVKLDDEGRVRFADLLGLAGIELKLDEKSHAKLNDLLELAAQKDGKKMDTYRDKVGEGVKTSLAQQFKNYDLTGMTWDKLTKSKEPRQHAPA